MDRIWLIWAGFHGFMSVALGAFGAHLLKETLTQDRLDVASTAARYQMYSALALLALAALPKKEDSKAAGWCLAAGSLVFSGSLYAYALSGVKAFGALTPLGGVLLLAGWALIFKKGWGATST
jgi:uncharacterized membrane protein YgdD (TMEM256/DUF423 family)